MRRAQRLETAEAHAPTLILYMQAGDAQLRGQVGQGCQRRLRMRRALCQQRLHRGDVGSWEGDALGQVEVVRAAKPVVDQLGCHCASCPLHMAGAGGGLSNEKMRWAGKTPANTSVASLQIARHHQAGQVDHPGRKPPFIVVPTEDPDLRAADYGFGERDDQAFGPAAQIG